MNNVKSSTRNAAKSSHSPFIFRSFFNNCLDSQSEIILPTYLVILLCEKSKNSLGYFLRDEEIARPENAKHENETYGSCSIIAFEFYYALSTAFHAAIKTTSVLHFRVLQL